MSRVRGLLAVVALAIVGGACGAPSQSPTGARPTAAAQPVSPYHHPQAVFLSLLANCVAAAGFQAIPQENGGILTPGHLTEEEQAELDAAYKTCTVQLDPRRAEPPPELTDGQWQDSYRYLLAEVGCLHDLGHAVPPPPSFDEWRATDRAWDPFVALINRGSPAPGYHVLTCQNVAERPSFLDW